MYLRQIGKKWYFTIWVTLPDGKRKKIERVGGKTQKEARDAARALIRKEDINGTYCDPGEITLQQCVEKWLTITAKALYSEETYKTYRSVARSKIFKPIGDMKLKDVTTIFLQEYLMKLTQENSQSLTTTTSCILRNALNMAVTQCHWLGTNPMIGVMYRHKATRSQTRNDMVFSKEELDRIFARFHGEINYESLIQLAYHMGLRGGECLALRWMDVDFENNLMCIHATRHDKNVKEIMVSEHTKNGKTRTIAMDAKMVEFLKGLKKQQEIYRRCYEDLYQESDFVCTRQDGHPCTRREILYINRWLKENGIVGHFHTFRHTHATMLLEAGIDLNYISKRLGHASITTTSNTYLHITDCRNKHAIEIMNQAL